MTNKKYALYIEEADKEANKLKSDVVMVVEVTHLKPTIICC